MSKQLFELPTEVILRGLAPLIEEGRIKGVITVDGIDVANADLQNIVDVGVGEYDENGLSYEMSHKCVRIKRIDDFIDELAKGDEYERTIAKSTSQWYGLMIPYRYDENDDEWQILGKNTRKAFMFGISGPYATGFRLFGLEYWHKESGSLKESLTNTEDYSGEWQLSPWRYGTLVPNHLAVGWGNFAYQDHPDWVENMTQKFPDQVIEDMKRKIERARQLGENPGVIEPQFSPGR